MKVKIKTRVLSSLGEIEKGFNRELFLKLSPPFPPVKLTRFDGCVKGDKVSLSLNFLFFKQRWESDIVEDGRDTDSWFFVDKGVKLPFFLKTWLHRHEVLQRKDTSFIIDDIHFTTGSLLTDFLMFPLLYIQFLYRKPIYQKVFSKKKTSIDK